MTFYWLDKRAWGREGRGCLIASEPVGERSRATELPWFSSDEKHTHISLVYDLLLHPWREGWGLIFYVSRDSILV